MRPRLSTVQPGKSSPRSAGRSRGRPAEPHSTGRLTGREQQVVELLARGLRNREIGERLSIGEGTVKVHLHNIFKKMGVHTRLALVRLAEDRGWI